MIKRIKKFIPESQFKTIYHSLFASHLSYCISAWGGAASTKLTKLFSIQKRCMRILFGEKLSFDHAEYYETCARAKTYKEHMTPKNYILEHTKPLFNKHKLLTIHNLYNMTIFMETFKILKKHTPISIFSLFSLNPHSNRHSLIPPKLNLDISKNNFVFKASSIWNLSIQKIFNSHCLDVDKNIIIPGSCPNSDYSICLFYKK